MSRVEELGLHEAVDAKALLDVRTMTYAACHRTERILQGRDVVRVLEAGKPGAWTGSVLSSVIEWQLEYPHGTKEECEHWLKAEQVAGKISLDVAPAQRRTPAKRGKADDCKDASKRTKTEGQDSSV